MILQLPHASASEAGPWRFVLVEQTIQLAGVCLIEHRR
jgi:hypothetical protein